MSLKRFTPICKFNSKDYKSINIFAIMTIKAVIFDWGGVMCVDSDFYTARVLAKRYNLDVNKLNDSFEYIESKYTRLPDNDGFFQEVIKENNLQISKEELEILFNQTPTRREMLDLVKKLKSDDIITAVLSTQMKVRADYIKANNDLSNFDYLFFSNEMGVKKPDKEAFIPVLEKINHSPEKCIFIDDNQRNLDTAEKLGIKTVLFKNYDQFRKDFKSLYPNI
jgi:HAD superfamily hydrolase (TIGR01509 family)